MAGELTCVAICDPPVVVLRVTGQLNLSTAAQLRTAMLKCLTDQPTAVLVDVAALTMADDIHLMVFAAVARHAAAWPSIPIVVCAAPPPITAALTRLGIDRQVTLVAGRQEGRVRAARRTVPVSVSDGYPPILGAVGAARHLVHQVCLRWGLSRLAPVAGLVVTELVSNAVRHAGTRVDLVVTRTSRYVHLAVRDYVTQPPRLVGPIADDEPGGRGVLIIEALATCWGCTPTRDGKVTWATLSTR